MNLNWIDIRENRDYEFDDSFSVFLLVEWKYNEGYKIELTSAIFYPSMREFETVGPESPFRPGIKIKIKENYKRADPIPICFLMVSDLEQDAINAGKLYEHTSRNSDQA